MIKKTFLPIMVLCFITELTASQSIEQIGLKNFTSDGCSMFIEGTYKDPKLWCQCCLDHDLEYWQGGTKQQRLQADLTFKECVYDKTKNSTLSQAMYDGVRIGGSPYMPTWYRWGYGWKKGWMQGRGYTPVSIQEKNVIEKYLTETNIFEVTSRHICD